MDKMKNKRKVLRIPRTTIFKLVGPCGILSHGQKVVCPTRISYLARSDLMQHEQQSRSYFLTASSLFFRLLSSLISSFSERTRPRPNLQSKTASCTRSFSLHTEWHLALVLTSAVLQSKRDREDLSTCVSTALRVLCWLSAKARKGFTRSSVIKAAIVLCVSAEEAISSAMKCHALATVPELRSLEA